MERRKIGNDMATLLNDEVPAVIAYFNKNLRASRATVKNLTGSMSNYLDLTQVWVEA
jgi:peptide/nickel transport system substrate-binding protein